MFLVQPPFDRLKKDSNSGSGGGGGGSASAGASPSGSTSKLRARTSSSPKKALSSPDKQRLARPGGASKQKRQKSPSASLITLKRDATEEGDVTQPAAASVSRDGILAQLVNEQVPRANSQDFLPVVFTSRFIVMFHHRKHPLSHLHCMHETIYDCACSYKT